MRWLPWSTGAGTLAGHHGWSPSILVQVSNILPLKGTTKGKVHCPQPVGVGYDGGADVADQIARNPVEEPTSLEENITVIRCDSVMMLQGFVISPQCLDL